MRGLRPTIRALHVQSSIVFDWTRSPLLDSGSRLFIISPGSDMRQSPSSKRELSPPLFLPTHRSRPGVNAIWIWAVLARLVSVPLCFLFAPRQVVVCSCV